MLAACCQSARKRALILGVSAHVGPWGSGPPRGHSLHELEMSRASGSAHVDLQGAVLVATLLLHHWLGLSPMPFSGVLPQGFPFSGHCVFASTRPIEFMYVWAMRLFSTCAVGCVAAAFYVLSWPGVGFQLAGLMSDVPWPTRGEYKVVGAGW